MALIDSHDPQILARKWFLVVVFGMCAFGAAVILYVLS